MNMQTAIQQVINGEHLSHEAMQKVMHIIFSGEASDAQIGGFLVGLRIKGETVDEITAAAEIMRQFATPVVIDDTDLVDVVGTGGDGIRTFNVSTASAIVTAAAGAKVAKHGNRAASSKSGSADVLEAAGVRLDLNAAQVASCVEQMGIGFMFAPMHHGAMKHAIGPRKEMAVRTIFNILGPLTNPANAKRTLLGVYDKNLLEPMAKVLMKLGCEHALVVHARDGIDEISIGSITDAIEMKNGVLTHLEINPQDYGMQITPLDSLIVDGPAQSLEIIKTAFAGKAGAARDIIALNAGASIYVAGLASSIEQGIKKAQELMSNSLAAKKLQDYVDFTQNA